MSIKKSILILIISFMLPQSGFTQEGYTFINDCVTAFSTLHKMTIDYESELEKPKNIKDVKKAITQFNNDILVPLNLFVKGTKSSNSAIKDVSKDLHDLLADILTNNYDMLTILNNDKLDKKELNSKCTALLQKNKFASMFFGDISMGVCVSVMLESKDKKNDYIDMKEEDRNLIVKFLTDEYGASIVKGNTIESKTSYERASRIMFEFLNLPWVFLDK